MSNTNQVRFRASTLGTWLDERIGNEPTSVAFSTVARRDLERYYTALALALATVDLTPNEACLIVDTLNGSVIDVMLAQILHYEIADGIEDDDLAEKWEIDGRALLATVRGWSLLQTLAVLDAVERFWCEDRVGDSRGRVIRVGLARETPPAPAPKGHA